ncbi:MAG: hypothetical protein HXY38_04435 [Chloroflexi bacterium]|nr:hypothetical protein [Chloroflexota bacterium]
MLFEIVTWISAGVALLTSAAILISRDWRVSLGALALQYLAAFWLVSRHLPFAMSSVKLITGWMVVAILGMTRLSLTETEAAKQDAFYPRGIGFRLALMGIVVLAAFGAAPRIEAIIPGLGLPVIAGSFLLIGAGVAHLSVTSDLLRVALGLLTLLSGFEVIYAGVESAILVTGLLAAVNLGLGILGSYLLLASSVPITTPEKRGKE